MAVNYVAVVEELARCGLNSCDKDGNCAYQRELRARLEKNYIAAANALCRCGYVSLGSGEWTEEDAKIYVEDHLKSMQEHGKLTPEQEKLIPPLKRPISEICTDIRKKKQNLEEGIMSVRMMSV